MICLVKNSLFLLLLFGLGAFSLGSDLHVKFVGEFTDSEIANLRHADSTERETLENAIITRLENEGFPGARIVEKKNNDTLFVVLDRGDGFVFGKPRNAILGKTSPDVFARLTRLNMGDPFVRNDIVRSERMLERSGYFAKVKNVELYREQNRNRIVPLFYMQDASFSYAEGIVSYTSEDNEWAGTLDVNLRNLAGTARDLQMQGATGELDRYVSLKYKEPWLLNSDWNGLVRGSLEDDSLKARAILEMGLERPVGFEWDFAILGGIGNDCWSSAIEASYHSEDSFILPRHGTSMESSVRFKRYRDSSQYTVALQNSIEHYVPIWGSFVSRTAFAGGYLYPTNNDFDVNDLFSLGGVNSWKGYRPDFLKTRAYGNAEFAIRFQGIERTAFEAFYEPGLYRGRYPEHGWLAVHQYGLGIVQFRDSFSVSVFYALRPGVSPEEGLLHLGVKTLF